MLPPLLRLRLFVKNNECTKNSVHTHIHLNHLLFVGFFLCLLLVYFYYYYYYGCCCCYFSVLLPSLAETWDLRRFVHSRSPRKFSLWRYFVCSTAKYKQLNGCCASWAYFFHFFFEKFGVVFFFFWLSLAFAFAGLSTGKEFLMCARASSRCSSVGKRMDFVKVLKLKRSFKLLMSERVMENIC